ncbi:MAG: class I SAM-dependent methyltransferase [Treponema sp.]|nr:class I SAM-dependent methyltransferase [Treponema sp.]
MKEDDAINVSEKLAKEEHDLYKYESNVSQNKVIWIKKYLTNILNKGKILVDLGCGSGKQMFKVEELGLAVIGVELSEGMIKWAQRNKEILKSNAKIIKGSYFNILLENNSVDYVLFHKNIVECSYLEFEKIRDESYRILKNHGLFILTINENIEKYIENKKDSIENILNGCYEGNINTPNEKNIKYITYYWTMGFANYITMKKFRIRNILEMEEEKTRILIYEK